MSKKSIVKTYSGYVIDPEVLKKLSINVLMQDFHLQDEAVVVKSLLKQLKQYSNSAAEIFESACELVTSIREHSDEQSALDAFMLEYDLSSEEGVVLMCIAEALLRIPDNETAEKLIEDKLSNADWQKHLGHSQSLFVNASTWGLMLTGRIINLDQNTQQNYSQHLKKLIKRSGEPVIKLAMKQAMKIMGQQFVMEKNIKAAIKRSQKPDLHSTLCSFDMLGEAALTHDDATKYQLSYLKAIEALAKSKINGSGNISDLHQRSAISVKLSALHPRYEFSQAERLMQELLPKFKILALAARDADIGLTMDAEEADRLEISLMMFVSLLHDPELQGWNGLGIALQAFQKRAMVTLKWLAELAQKTGRQIPVRLVKGAYWDTEIKLAQELGLPGYPVFTRKLNTDISYLACAQFLLDHRDSFYPQFATHNAHTVVAILKMGLATGSSGKTPSFEFQRLHGMGGQLYQHVKKLHGEDIRCRVYAPVGSHEDLLPYLVRRLLENGANTSFVNRIVDSKLSVQDVVRDPVAELEKLENITNPAIALPKDMFGKQRLNSIGLNLASFGQQQQLLNLLDKLELQQTSISSISPIKSMQQNSERFAISKPYDSHQQIGDWQEPDAECVEQMIQIAESAQIQWDKTPVDLRAACLDKTANLLEQKMTLFIRLCVDEAGKTITDSVAEVREAADFCRYYAAMARQNLKPEVALPGPTGESNQLFCHGRGVFVCISPWNFPLAIFTGQIVAALVSGNSVLAKPAEQTNLIAWYATQCMLEAGIPEGVLQLVLGRGQSIGTLLTNSDKIAGVAFTGSNVTARSINQSLASRHGPIASLIAETGGQNVMIVDSSALPEQVIKDVLISAFGSSGQRCSALRVLFIQQDIADRIIELLKGAMAELTIGNPGLYKTDIGPVIDNNARQSLQTHINWLHQNAKFIASCSLPEATQEGNYIAPQAFEIDNLKQLTEEHFGPILHVIRYQTKQIDQVIEQINHSGYGLTLGIHSRIEKTWQDIQSRVRVGNSYVNRTMIGAMVGVQPFGGEGLSGTGPKAGGPHYLYRFITERTRTINTAAIGGNADLLSKE